MGGEYDKLESASGLSNHDPLMVEYACAHMANPSVVTVLYRQLGHSNC